MLGYVFSGIAVTISPSALMMKMAQSEHPE